MYWVTEEMYADSANLWMYLKSCLSRDLIILYIGKEVWEHNTVYMDAIEYQYREDELGVNRWNTRRLKVGNNLWGTSLKDWVQLRLLLFGFKSNKSSFWFRKHSSQSSLPRIDLFVKMIQL